MMPIRLRFTPNLRRHVDCPDLDVDGTTVRAALESCFRSNPAVCPYLLDDQGALRRHIAVFLNQTPVQDRAGLSEPVVDGDEIFVVQALSGG